MMSKLLFAFIIFIILSIICFYYYYSKYYFPLSSLLSVKWGFSEAMSCVILQQMVVEADLRISLFSLKADIKEIFKM